MLHQANIMPQTERIVSQQVIAPRAEEIALAETSGKVPDKVFELGLPGTGGDRDISGFALAHFEGEIRAETVGAFFALDQLQRTEIAGLKQPLLGI